MLTFALCLFMAALNHQGWAATVGCSRAEAPKSPIQPIATIKDIMDGTVDPSADFIWQSVATISRVTGIEEKQPRTEEEWQDVRNNAIRVIEARLTIGRCAQRASSYSERHCSEAPSTHRMQRRLRACSRS